MLFCLFTECRDVLLPMMLRELSGALASMADGPHDERRNSLELLNKILEVLSRDNVVRQCRHTHNVCACSPLRTCANCILGDRFQSKQGDQSTYW